MSLAILEAVPASFTALEPRDACTFRYNADRRRTIFCGVPGGQLQPGEVRQFTINFQVLTTPQPYAMKATGGQITVLDNYGNPVGRPVDFAAMFRSTDGSLRSPRPYVQDVLADASIRATGEVILVRQPDGSFAGRLPITVRWGGDAAHQGLHVVPALPAGVQVRGIDPPEVCTSVCYIAGGAFMEGEERTAALLLWAPAETAPGPLGVGSIEVGASWGPELLEDVDRSDNIASFTITAAEAG